MPLRLEFSRSFFEGLEIGVAVLGGFVGWGTTMEAWVECRSPEQIDSSGLPYERKATKNAKPKVIKFGFFVVPRVGSVPCTGTKISSTPSGKCLRILSGFDSRSGWFVCCCREPCVWQAFSNCPEVALQCGGLLSLAGKNKPDNPNPKRLSRPCLGGKHRGFQLSAPSGQVFRDEAGSLAFVDGRV